MSDKEKAPEIRVYIEIPEGSRVKYERDEETGDLVIDRVMPTTMGYPTNYGLIEETLGEDGDALDAFVFISEPVMPGVSIDCKIIGMLEMEDEEGVDNKIICVPKKAKVDPICGTWESLDDIPEPKKRAMHHFLEHYKDLEEGKFVKLKDWKDIKTAVEVLKKSQEKFLAAEEAMMNEMMEEAMEEEGCCDCEDCGCGCKEGKTCSCGQ